MPRPIWKGHISFGLVNIPVVLHAMETRNDLHFRMLDDRNKARVRYERVNEVTGEEVPWEHVVKAYEYEDDNYVLLSDEDFKQAAAEATQTVEIEDFVDVGDINLAYYDKPYMLVPGKKGEKGYVLLRETLKETGVAGIAQVVIRTKQYLSALVPQGDALELVLMRYDDELRKPADFDLPGENPSDYNITKKELDMARSLVESMLAEWKPEKYRDEYRDKLLDWIHRKAESHEEVTPPAPAEEVEAAGEIVDFMELLQKSVQEKRGDGGKAAGKSRKKAAKKKTKSKSKSKKRSQAS